MVCGGRGVVVIAWKGYYQPSPHHTLLPDKISSGTPRGCCEFLPTTVPTYTHLHLHNRVHFSFDFMHLHREQTVLVQVLVQVHFTSRWNTSLARGSVIQMGSSLPSSSFHPWSVGLLTGIMDLNELMDELMNESMNDFIWHNTIHKCIQMHTFELSSRCLLGRHSF